MTKHYLYIKTDPLHYSLVGEFETFNDAKAAKDATYPDKKFRILTEQAAIAEGKKQAKQASNIQQATEKIITGTEKIGRVGIKVAVKGGLAAGRALKRGAIRAGELHQEAVQERRAFEKEMYPVKVEQEKLYRQQAAEEARAQRALEFERSQELKKVRYEQELKAARERVEQPRPEVGLNIASQNREFFQQEQRKQRPIKEYQSGPGYAPAPFQEERGYDIGQPGQFKMPVYHTPVTSIYGGAAPQSAKKKRRK